MTVPFVDKGMDLIKTFEFQASIFVGSNLYEYLNRCLIFL